MEQQETSTTQRGWPLKLAFLENPPVAFSLPVSVIVISIFVAASAIAVIALAWLLIDLVSGDQKRAAEATKTALPILAGAISLPLIVWRLRILDRQTRISEQKTEIDRETHYTSIFSRAIEQLGETREIKRTVDGVDTTKTAPNIEVRLGGIHSLARLGEESLRDREKIKNILRSYVRENSWSDRAGDIVDKFEWPKARSTDWAYELESDSSDADAESRRMEWIEETKGLLSRAHEWMGRTPETRVDVNEAVDALASLPIGLPSDTKPFFYECLFVGRRFGTTALAAVDFRRCTFSKCTFDARDTRFELFDCDVMDSTFHCSNSNISILSSRLSNTNLYGNHNSSSALNSCGLYSLRLVNLPQLELNDSTLYKVTIVASFDSDRSLRSAKIDLFDSIVVGSSMRRMKLLPESNLYFATSPTITFDDMDLSGVSNIAPGTLRNTKADATTLHPSKALRPPSWPKFKPRQSKDILPTSSDPDQKPVAS